VALALLAPVYAWTRLPEPPEGRAALARRFAFAEPRPLPVVTVSNRSVRTLRPSLRPIANWMSGLGAAVALHDLDGDGLANDVAYVDVRSDQVIVAPVPGTPARYTPFELLRAPGCASVPATAPMGVLPGDVDEDGVPDLLVYFWGRSPLLYHRLPERPLGVDAFVCQELVTPRREWYTNAATFADLDGDGHADLVLGDYFPDGAGILDPRSTSTAMQMQESMSLSHNGGGDHVFLWTPQGFREVPDALPPITAGAWTLAIGAQDLDGDLLPELYLANDFGPDHLLANHSTPGHLRFTVVNGRRRFGDPKSTVLGDDSFKSMGVDFADLNGDGVPDIVVSDITEPYGLLESALVFVSGPRPLEYHNAAEALGLSRGGWDWDARFGDFDDDGVPELVQAAGFARGTVNRWPELQELALANDQVERHVALWPRFPAGSDLSGGDRDPFYARASDGRWYDVGAALGMPAGALSRGIATADVDGDGRLDLVIANQWGPSFFYQNRTRGGRSLVLHLLLGDGTRAVAGPPAGVRASPAIGAQARLTAGGTTQVAQVDGGNGHSGKRAPELHFGLGRSTGGSVDVRWRDRCGAIQQTRFQVAAGTWTLLLDGRCHRAV
jgi:hypothetical protein